MRNEWRGSCEWPLSIHLHGLNCHFELDVLEMEPVVDLDTFSA